MLLAYEKGAALIVSVGAHFNLVEFLERRRGGMSSTFLTRLRIGETLVDAKGVSRLYPAAAWCAGRTTAGRRVIFPLGRAVCSRRPSSRLAARPQPVAGRSLPASATSACSTTWPGARPRGWRGHGLAVSRGELSTGAIKAVGHGGPRRLRGAGPARAGLSYRRVARPRPGGAPRQPAGHAAGPLGEGPRAGARRSSASASPAPLEPLGRAAPPLPSRSAPGSPCASGRCSATPARA